MPAPAPVPVAPSNRSPAAGGEPPAHVSMPGNDRNGNESPAGVPAHVSMLCNGPNGNGNSAGVPGHVSMLCSTGVGLFFGLMFVLPSGYSYGASILLLLALWCAWAPSCQSCRVAASLSRDDRAVVAALVGYFGAAFIMALWLGNDLADLDQPLRAALAALPLWMLLRVPFDLRWLWGGVVAGVTLSVGVAAWQLYLVGMERAEGFLNIIHFGNIALVFGAFCAAGMQWAVQLPPGRRHLWWAAFAMGMASSVYSIIASGSRGSWVALPVLVALYAIAFLNRRNLKWTLGAIAVIGVLAAVLFSQPDSRLRERYDAATQDIELYMKGEADTSLGARFVMWKGALLNIPERPLLGWNMDAYDARIAERVASGELNPVALKFTDNLHNSYLQALAFQGLPGLLALLAVYFVPLTGFCRRLRDSDIVVSVLAYCGAAVCASYVFFSLTQVILRRNNGIMFYVVAVAVMWGAMRMRERSNRITTCRPAPLPERTPVPD